MPLTFGNIPNFNVQQPPAFDPLAQQQKQATLSGMLDVNAARRQLDPLILQEQQEKAKQAGIQTQSQQQDLDSRKAMMAAIASGELNKYAGVETPDGSGFDAAGAYQHLISKGVLPAQAGEYANSWLTIGKNQAEISKNLGEAGKAQQEIREKTLKQVANKLGDIGDMNLGKASKALDAFRQDLVANPKAYTGLTQQEMAELYSADLTHLDALEGHLGIAAQVADFHKLKAEAAAVEGKTDPNSPNYSPSAAYLAQRAAAGDQQAKTILAQEANQAGAKAGSEAAARLPFELALKREELAQNPVFASNPKTGLRELTTVADAKANGFTNPMKVSQGDVEKESQLNSQVNDMQLNLSRYRASLNAMSGLSATDRAGMTHILSDPSVNNLLLQGAGFPAVISMAEQSGKGRDWNALSSDKQDALIGYLRMKNTGLLAQKVLTGMGRASKEALDIELANMPSPIEGATVGNKKLEAWQQNVDQMASRTVKLPWMEQSSDVKSRIEAQATQQYNQAQAGKQQGQYRPAPGFVPTVGKNVQIANTPGLSRVKKIYPDGSFDADQKP